MSIDKDTFEELGLQGKCSRYQKHRYGELVCYILKFLLCDARAKIVD